MTKKTACIVLAAGKGTRMKSTLAKPLHKVAGRSMIEHVLSSVSELNPEKIIVVIGSDMPEMTEAVKPHTTAIQQIVNGTGGAVLAAQEHLDGFDGDILIIYGDTPLVTSNSLQRIVDARRQLPAIGIAFSGVQQSTTSKFGRMIMDDDGTLKKIVEFKDATAEEKEIPLCNGGIVCADGTKLFDWLSQIGNDNAQKEYYLTDLPQIARKDNRQTVVVDVPVNDVAGANDRAELAIIEKLMQQRLRKQHMLNGVTLVDPDTVTFSHDTEIAQDVTIGANVVFGEGVSISTNVEILPFCHIEGANINEGAKIGPFARIRPDTHVSKNAKIGNFVEIKNVTVGTGVKINHLSYIGDADIGEDTNIGAGCVTVNYDGFMKYRTTIGKNTMIGCNSALIAPITISDGAYIGAGSSIYEDVESNALALTRAPQIEKEGWTVEFRRKKIKEKAKKDR